MAKRRRQENKDLSPPVAASAATPTPTIPNASGPIHVHQRVTHQAFEGPLPHPTILEQYNAIVPDAAERIIRVFESESAHRQRQEDTALQANIQAQSKNLDIISRQSRDAFSSDTKGQWLGFAVSIASVVGAVYLASIGHDWAAVALVSLPLAGIIRALREQHHKSQAQKESPPE